MIFFSSTLIERLKYKSSSWVLVAIRFLKVTIVYKLLFSYIFIHICVCKCVYFFIIILKTPLSKQVLIILNYFQCLWFKKKKKKIVTTKEKTLQTKILYLSIRRTPGYIILHMNSMVCKRP